MKVLRIAPDKIEVEGQNAFHKLSQDVFKVQPLKQYCVPSNVKYLLSGVRRGQTRDCDHFNFIQYSGDDPAKARPILDCSDEKCLQFVSFKIIPSHPKLGSLLRVMVSSEESDNARVEISSSVSSLMGPSLLSRCPSQGSDMECGIHIQANGGV